MQTPRTQGRQSAIQRGAAGGTVWAVGPVVELCVGPEVQRALRQVPGAANHAGGVEQAHAGCSVGAARLHPRPQVRHPVDRRASLSCSGMLSIRLPRPGACQAPLTAQHHATQQQKERCAPAKKANKMPRRQAAPAVILGALHTFFIAPTAGQSKLRLRASRSHSTGLSRSSTCKGSDPSVPSCLERFKVSTSYPVLPRPAFIRLQYNFIRLCCVCKDPRHLALQEIPVPAVTEHRRPVAATGCSTRKAQPPHYSCISAWRTALCREFLGGTRHGHVEYCLQQCILHLRLAPASDLPLYRMK